MVIERHRKVRWQEIIVLSVARALRISPKIAEDVIRALLETQTPEGILLAGRCVLEIVPLKNAELHERISQSLHSLTTDTQIADAMREQAREIIDELNSSQDSQGAGG